MNPQDIAWVLSFLSIFGAVMNARKSRLGLIIWFIANTGWILFNIYTKTYQQIPVWIAFNVINIYGLFYWTKEREQDGTKIKEKSIRKM